MKLSKKPTICLCIRSIEIGTTSGTKRYALELYKELKKNKKYNIILITAPKGSVYDRIPILFLPFCFYKLLKLLLNKKIDLFHPLSFAYSYFLPFVKLFGVKTVITIADVPKTYSTKYMDSSILDYIKIKLYKIFIKFSDYFFAISELNISRLQQEMKINKKRIFLFSLGIDEKFKPENDVEKNKIFTIGYLGGRISLDNIKYTIDLIRSFKDFSEKHPNSRLMISGRDKFNFIENFIKKTNNKKIIYRRFIPEKDIVKFYNSLDVFVFPSAYEGFGLPIMEAKRCGIPVMLMKKAMISEEIKKHCLEYDSIEDLVEKLHILYKNRRLLKSIGEKSYKYAMKFTWPRSVDIAINNYDKILG